MAKSSALLVSFMLILVLCFMGTGCETLRIGGKPSGGEIAPLSSNELITQLKKDEWVFINIPTADIDPGSIFSMSENGFRVVGSIKDCFSQEVLNGLAVEGPFEAALPYLEKQYSFNAETSAVFSDYFTAGPEYSTVKDFILEIGGAAKYKISNMRLKQAINDHWSDVKDKICGQQLRKMPTQIVTAVLKATNFKLTVRDKTGGSIRLTIADAGKYFSFKSGVKYEMTTDGGLKFENNKSLPFAFQGERVDVPEPRGQLEILQGAVHFPRKQFTSTLDVRNSGKLDLIWYLKREPERGFVVKHRGGSLKANEERALVIKRTPECIDVGGNYHLALGVEETEQVEVRPIRVEEECPSAVEESQLMDEASRKLAQGQSLYRAGAFEEAWEAMAEVKIIDPDLADSLTYKRAAGLASFKAGKKEESLKNFQALAAGSKGGHAYLANVLASKEDFQDAEKQLAKGRDAFEGDPWLRAEIMNAFNKPIDQCSIPPTPIGMLYRDQVAEAVENLKGLQGLRLQAVLEEELSRLKKIDRELAKVYAVTAFCELGRGTPISKSGEVADTLNAAVRKAINEKTFDVRPRPFFEKTEAQAVKVSGLQERIVKVLQDYAGFISNRLNVPKPNLRVNIFMLDRSGVLRIPEGLSYNMHDLDELTIKIPVGYGASGVAFEKRRLTGKLLASPGQPQQEERVSLIWSGWAVEGGKELWESRDIELPLAESRKAHRGLAWIVSTPIFEQITGDILGVLNVDCVDVKSVFEGYEATCRRVSQTEIRSLETDAYYWSFKVAALLKVP